MAHELISQNHLGTMYNDALANMGPCKLFDCG